MGLYLGSKGRSWNSCYVVFMRLNFGKLERNILLNCCVLCELWVRFSGSGNPCFVDWRILMMESERFSMQIRKFL